MAFNLGAFAGGLATGAVKTYQTMTEMERLKAAEERDKVRFESEQAKLQQEKQADEQLSRANAPTTGGVPLSEIASALPLGDNQNTSVSDAQQREAFQTALANMTPQQQEAVLRGYGKVALPNKEQYTGTTDMPLSGTGVYEDATGTRRVGALETDEKKILENRKRIAAQSGNPIAIKRAEEAETTYLAREASKQTIKKTGYEIDAAERQQTYDKAVDKYSDKHVKMGQVLNSLAKAELKDVPDIINGELKTYGYTATYINDRKASDAAGVPVSNVVLKDKEGKILSVFDSPEKVRAALEGHAEEYTKNMANDLINLLPNPKDRFAALNDIQEMAIKKGQLANDTTRTATDVKRAETEEANVQSQIYSRDEATMLSKNDLLLRQKQVDQTIKQFEHQSKIDVAKLYLEFGRETREDRRLELAETIADTQRDQENQRIGLAASQLSLNRTLGERGMTVQEARQKTDEKLATLAETRNGWEKSVAEARNSISDKAVQINRDEFLEAQKLTPGKIRELDAHVKLYNAEADYRKAAAKELGNGSWKVLGTDKDGTPISMDSQTGKFARPDGKPIQDIDFFRKITGAAPEKIAFTAKDLLTFTEAYGDTIVGQKDGQKIKLKDLPPEQQAAKARAFFSGTAALADGGLDNTVKPAPPPAAPTSALPTTAARPVVTTLGADTARQGLPVTADTAQAGAAAGTALRNTIGGAASAIDTGMSDAGKRFLQGKIDRKEPLDALQTMQAKRAGLIAP
jgi:hypothetical protein